MTPVGAGNIFLRHRQACQKLRKGITSSRAYCVYYCLFFHPPMGLKKVKKILYD
jgi:hypothetical protein